MPEGNVHTVTGPEVPLLPIAASKDNPPAQANTTSEQDRHTASQRQVNMLWEHTQQFIALGVVGATLLVAAFKTIYDALMDATRGIAAGPAFLFLVGASNLVIGFYFGRTNHQRVGGVGGESALGGR